MVLIDHLMIPDCILEHYTRTHATILFSSESFEINKLSTRYDCISNKNTPKPIHLARPALRDHRQPIQFFSAVFSGVDVHHMSPFGSS